jgi:hypothetical protein
VLAGKVTVEDITETWYECSGNNFDKTGTQHVTNSQVVVFVSYAAGCWLALFIGSGANRRRQTEMSSNLAE